MMIKKPLHLITEADVRTLYEDRVREGRRIEYKSRLPDKSEKHKHRFLAGISSLANTDGGDVLFGIEEKDGLPIGEPNPIQITDLDGEVQRLESMLQNGIDPRIESVRFKEVSLDDSSGVVLVARVGKSWNAPHAVTLGGATKFFGRNSIGKFPMDVDQIRDAFLRTSGLIDRIRTWRMDRISVIESGRLPLVTDVSPRLAAHLIPLESMASPNQLNAKSLEAKREYFSPSPGQRISLSRRVNLDGYLNAVASEDSVCPAYCQIFRSGCIEWVETGILSRSGSIRGDWVESIIVKTLGKMLEGLQELGIQGRIAVFVSLLRVRGASMHLNVRHLGRVCSVEHEDLHFPEVLIDSPSRSLGRDLRPIFDSMWNSCGVIECPNYNDHGEWIDSIT